MNNRKRYALVGAGGRASTFIAALVGDQPHYGEMVAVCDPSPTRMAYHNRTLVESRGLPAIPTYTPDAFDRMLAETRPEVVMVTTPDYLHHEYTIRAMRAGCDVICEKPITIDAEKLRAVFAAKEQTGRSLRISFNLRYAPEFVAVKQVVHAGTIGRPLAADLSWVLDTSHGADYFRRWHREKDKSGGLLVHKATHHFDAVNWFVDSYPQRVFCMGELKFYGKAAAEARGERYAYDRYRDMPAGTNDPFAMRLDRDETTRELYMAPERDSGYVRDRNVFGPGITIEDTMVLSARYRNGVLFNYSLVTYAPWEGLRVAITGTKGRVELYIRHQAHVVDFPPERKADADEATRPLIHVRVFPMFGLPYDVPVERAEGGHGGADPRMLEHIFAPEVGPDPLKQAATHIDGAASALLGICANQSIATGMPVDCDQVFKLP